MYRDQPNICPLIPLEVFPYKILCLNFSICFHALRMFGTLCIVIISYFKTDIHVRITTLQLLSFHHTGCRLGFFILLLFPSYNPKIQHSPRVVHHSFVVVSHKRQIFSETFHTSIKDYCVLYVCVYIGT